MFYMCIEKKSAWLIYKNVNFNVCMDHYKRLFSCYISNTMRFLDIKIVDLIVIGFIINIWYNTTNVNRIIITFIVTF